MKGECKPKKSWIGGFCGGLIGCLAGILCQSDWLAMILFFVFGFIGYDFREFISVSARVIKSVIKELKGFFISCYQDSKPYLPYPYLHVIAIPIFTFYLTVACAISPQSLIFPQADITGFWSFLVNSPKYFWPLLQHGFFLNTFNYLIIVVSLIEAIFTSIAFVWILKGFVYLTKNIPATYAWSKQRNFGWVWIKEMSKKVARAVCWCYNKILKTPILLCLIIIYATFGPIVYFFKALGLIAIGIHSYRRMACGISTLAGGIVYMMCVPFAIEGISLGIQAIFFALGCGLACGVFATAVDSALDGEQVRKQLKVLLKLSIYKAIPAKIKF